MRPPVPLAHSNERSEMLRELNLSDSIEGISFAEDLTPVKILALALNEGVQHIIQAKGPTFKTELLSSIRMLENASEFFREPTHVVLGKERKDSFVFKFHSSNQKNELMSRFEKVLDQIPGTSTIRDSAMRIADEMFTNALFNAPVDEASQFTHADSPRHLGVELTPGDEAIFIVSYDLDSLALACIDRFGSLKIENLLKRIQECYERGLSHSIRSTHGGAGIGCHAMFEMSSSFYLGVQSGKKTVICCKLSLHRSFKETGLLFKNLHWVRASGDEGEKMSNSSQNILKIHGDLNEDFIFSSLTIQGQGETILDLSAVRSLNSCGIREWIRWIKAAPTSARLVLKECPKVVVDQINMVDGFLPKGTRIQSFMVPYYCEACEKVKSVLFKEGEHYAHGKMKSTLPPVSCDQCQQPMEWDVIESKYFKFLQGMSE